MWRIATKNVSAPLKMIAWSPKRESHQREIEERNRRKRTEAVAWLALLIGGASLIMNIVDKVA